MTSIFPARYPGTCALTGRSISIGDSITRGPRGYQLAAVSVAAAPFSGPLGYHGSPLTREERRINDEAQAVLDALNSAGRWNATLAEQRAADAAYAALSEPARRRYTALAEQDNPYDR